MAESDEPFPDFGHRCFDAVAHIFRKIGAAHRDTLNVLNSEVSGNTAVFVFVCESAIGCQLDVRQG